MTLLKVGNLSKTYRGEKKASLEGLDLDIQEHQVFGFLGPNGAGKTTTIKILTGLMSPSAGDIFLRGEKMNHRDKKLRSRLGYLGQEPRYYPWMTGEELLIMVAGLFGQPPEQGKKRAAELLELTGLTEARKKRVGAYSGGMVQRLGIAQALVNRPEILFLDEPVSALDPLGRKEVLDLIGRLKETTTVFMSTHILADVERVCDRVGILKEGSLIALETTESLKEKYSPRRKELVFDSGEGCREVSSWLRTRGVPVLEDCNGTAALSLGDDDYLRIGGDLLAFLASGNIGLQSLTDSTAGLEEIFINLVGADHG
ncbi:MAG: ABC transporter ATP-binding protein [Spirochaetales bacterium]|nr:ABC transporter ATP-binding protein [Spirochaetales bacterium]